jgi:SAM-dependent methyltransferase
VASALSGVEGNRPERSSITKDKKTMQLSLLIILSLFTLWLISQFYHCLIHRRAPWFPSPISVRKNLLQSIELHSGQVFAELGAGTGKLARQLAKKYPTNQIYAYEISYLPFFIGSLLASRYPNLNFIRGDITKADLSMVDTFYVFTGSSSMKDLATKLSKHPKPATLYSYLFRLPDKPIHSTLEVGLQPIYVYQL